MTSSGDTSCLDLVQAVKSGYKVQTLVKDLLRYFTVETITEGKGYSIVDCVYDASIALDEIREEFKKEFVRSKKVVITPLIKNFVNVNAAHRYCQSNRP